MLSQHMSAHRPISLEAVIAYARGLGVPIEQISPRLAGLLSKAVDLLGPGSLPAASAPVSPGLPAALDVVLEAIEALPPARWVSVRAQLDQVAAKPEMRDEAKSELLELLQAGQPKHREAA